MGIVLNNDVIEKVTCKLCCGSKNGTAFLLSNKYVITATHCIADYTEDIPITLEFRNMSDVSLVSEARPTEDPSIHKYPIIILELDSPLVATGLLPVDLMSIQLRPGMEIDIYGYPQVKLNDGIWTKGTIARAITENQVNTGDWNLHISSLNSAIKDFEGYSGSPLLHNGKVVGIIGEQTLVNGQAISINAVDITRISEYLHCHNISVEVEKVGLGTPESILNRHDDTIVSLSHAITNLSTLNQKLGDDHTSILDKEYNAIVEMRINGDHIQALKKLDDMLSSPYSLESKSYAKLYFLAAQWALEKDLEKANQYLNLARKIDRDLDDRIYQSALYEQNKDYGKAESILYPIDSTVLFNQWLLLQYKQNRYINIDETLNTYKHIEQNDGTYYCLLLFYLRASNFEKAKEYANLLTAKHDNSCVFWDISALVYYWEAIPPQVDHKPGEAFVIFLNGNMPFTKMQLTSAEIALEHYQKALDLSTTYLNTSIKNNALIGSLVINWMLNRIDAATNFAEQLLDSDKGNPIAMQFLADNRISLDIYMKDLITRTQNDSLAALVYIKILMQQENYEQANIIFSDFQDRIKLYSTYEWIVLCIEFALKQNKISDAYAILSANEQDLQDDEIKRFTLYIYQFDDKKSQNDEIALAEEIKELYGELVDYQNLCTVYRKYKKWHRIPKPAKEWNKKYNDIMALYFLAQSQFYRGYAKKALKTINQISAIHDLPISLKRMKVDCHTQIAEYDNALEIIKDIGLSQRDENLVVQHAKIELSKGDVAEAIRILQTYIGLNERSISATMMLVDLLEKESPKEAFEIACRLCELNPGRNDIAMKAIHVGFMSGNDLEAHKLMMKVLENDPEEKYFKKFDTKNIMEFFAQQNEKTKKIDQNYLDGLIPQHAYFDLKNNDMGYHVYSNWVLGYDHQLFWCYGGRPINNLINYFKDEVLLDYSAVLTIECLDLFPLIEKTFSGVIVSPNLIPCIINEVRKLSNIQESVRQKHESIYKFFHQQNKKISIIEDCPVLSDQNTAAPHDYVEYNTAKKLNALIVTDSFACETIYQKTAPKELLDMQVYESEVWEALYQKGLIPKRTYQKTPREKILHTLMTESKPLLVNRTFLEELSECANLSDIGSVLSLVILKSDITMIDDYIKGVAQQEKCAQWLESLHKKLSQLERKGFLRFCPLSAEDRDHGALTSILLDTLEFSTNNGIPLWVDDRCVNSYFHTQHGILFGIFDFVYTMYCSNSISLFDYRNLINKLISNKVVFNIPSVEYIFSNLKIASTNDGRVLHETDSLTKLRRYVSQALMSSSCISKIERSDYTLSEIQGFLLILNRHCHDLLQQIWNDDKAPQDWKIAASNWVWKYLSDFICDVQLGEKYNINDGITTKHAIMIFDSLRIKPSNVSGYRDWVFTLLYLYWIFNPDNKQSVAHAVAVLLCSDRSERTDILNLDLYEEILIMRLQSIIPPDFFGLVLDDPLCKSKWGERYEEIQVEMTPLNLPLNSDDEIIKYTSECDFVQELHQYPDKWQDIIAAVIQYSNDDPLVATISFMNSYIDKHGSENIANECKDAIEQLIWYTPSEYRLDIQELRRRF